MANLTITTKERAIKIVESHFTNTNNENIYVAIKDKDKVRKLGELIFEMSEIISHLPHKNALKILLTVLDMATAKAVKTARADNRQASPD